MGATYCPRYSGITHLKDIVKVVPHNCKIQDFEGDFYSKFHLVVCGLDSVVARY